MKKSDLLPLNAVVQICPECGKVDAYKNDGHNCMDYILNQERSEILDWRINE